MNAAAAAPASLFPLIRMLLLLAVVGFFAGFGGYLVFGPPDAAGLGARAKPAAAAAPTAASVVSTSVDDEFNPPRQT